MPESLAKRQKTMSNPSDVVDATKTSQGDLVIRAGDEGEAVLIRVHSALLKMAAPVFRAMLGPNFVEGSTQYSAVHPLWLKEDHPEAMLDLCALLHHQYPDALPLSRYPNLIIIADKYQCNRMLKPWFVSAFTQYFTSPVTEEVPALDKIGLNLESAMCLAYAVGDAELFWRISRKVVVQSRPKKVGQAIEQRCLDLVPEKMLDTIQAVQSYERRQLAIALEKAEHSLLQPVIGSNDMCNRLRYTVGKYNYQLWIRYLKQTDVDHDDQNSLDGAYEHVEEIVECCGPSCDEIRKAKCVKGCNMCPTNDFEEELREIVEARKRQCKGLCLECVRKGAEVKAEEDCEHKFKE